MARKRDVTDVNRKVKPIPNHTGQRYPGTGGKVVAPKMNDCVDEFDSHHERELDVPQAGEEAW
jgi:hypothetical protein